MTSRHRRTRTLRVEPRHRRSVLVHAAVHRTTDRLRSHGRTGADAAHLPTTRHVGRHLLRDRQAPRRVRLPRPHRDRDHGRQQGELRKQLRRQLVLLLQVAMGNERSCRGVAKIGFATSAAAQRRRAARRELSTRHSGAVLDDRGDEFFAAADGSSERVVGPPAGIFFPGAADQCVSLLPVALGECERLCRPLVVLAGLLDSRIRWHEPRSRSAGSAGRRRTRRCPACRDLLGRRW